MSDWSLRLARGSDAESFPSIEASASRLFDTVEGLGGIAGQHTIPVERLRRCIAKGHCLVALSGERLVGFLVNEPFSRELHLWEFDVHSKFQQQGIGAGLMRACQIDARNCGFRALTLTTFREVPWNAPFYERLGFVEIADVASHPRLHDEIEKEVAHGLPRERRCAMICFLD